MDTIVEPDPGVSNPQPLLAADNRRRRSGLTAAFVVVSLALHAGAGAALLVSFQPHLSGAVPIETGAVSIELVAARDLETVAAPEVAATPPAMPQPAAAPAVPAAKAEQEQEPKAEDKPEPKAEQEQEPKAEQEQEPKAEAAQAAGAATPSSPEPPAEVAMAAPAPVAPEVAEPTPADAQPAPTVTPRQVEPAPVDTEPVPLPSRRPTPPRSASEDDSDDDAAKAPAPRTKPARPAPRPPTSTASAGSAGAAARASAARGALIAYRSRVQSRVASRPPAGIGASGQVVIGFAISPSGGLASASVARSSGNPALDRLALSSLRSAAPFPPPPAGSLASDLRFAFPYTFR